MLPHISPENFLRLYIACSIGLIAWGTIAVIIP